MPTPPNLNDLIERHLAGEPIKRLADEAGIGRRALKNRFLEAGVTPRGRGSDSVRLALATLPPDRRLALQESSRRGGASRRGTQLSDSGREALALGRARSRRWVTADETALLDWLHERGEPDAIAQVAIGSYNIDIGLAGHIAVEVQRADTVAHTRERRRMLQRIEQLRERGWHVIYVLWMPDVMPVVPAVADELVAEADMLRRDPTAPREYRVIWGDGKYLSRGDHDLDELARIWPTRSPNRLRAADAD